MQPAKETGTLPTEKEIAQLPRWARVAFAARCARRVEPLYLKCWPNAPEKYVLGIGRAVDLTEESAAAAIAYHDASVLFDAATAPTTKSSSVVVGPEEAAEVAASATGAYSAIRDSLSGCSAVTYAVRSAGSWVIPVIRHDLDQIVSESRSRRWTDATPVPPAVFGPLWPEGPPADWPELPKPTKLKVTVQVPDGLDDAAVREKLKTLTTALARLNVAGGGHGLKLIPPIDFTHEQDKGRSDVVREEGEKPKGRGNARRGH